MSEGEIPQRSPYTGVSHFFPTSRRIVQFSEGREPKPDDIVIYIDGGFDLFHVGHCKILEMAKALGQYLIVGIYDDPTVNSMKGGNYPIMNLHERVLAVLSWKFVDEVVIGAPLTITKDFINLMRINKVCHGSVGSDESVNHYQVALEMGIVSVLKSPSTLTTEDVVQRIILNRLKFEERNLKKQKKELNEISSREGNVAVV